MEKDVVAEGSGLKSKSLGSGLGHEIPTGLTCFFFWALDERLRLLSDRRYPRLPPPAEAPASGRDMQRPGPIGSTSLAALGSRTVAKWPRAALAQGILRALFPVRSYYVGEMKLRLWNANF